MCKALAKIMKPEIDEAFNNGFNDGYGKGIQKTLFSFLEDLGKVTDEIKNYILSEKDADNLNTWFKIAARAESIDDFWTKIR